MSRILRDIQPCGISESNGTFSYTQWTRSLWASSYLTTGCRIAHLPYPYFLPSFIPLCSGTRVILESTYTCTVLQGWLLVFYIRLLVSVGLNSWTFCLEHRTLCLTWCGTATAPSASEPTTGSWWPPSGRDTSTQTPTLSTTPASTSSTWSTGQSLTIQPIPIHLTKNWLHSRTGCLLKPFAG